MEVAKEKDERREEKKKVAKDESKIIFINIFKVLNITCRWRWGWYW